jgi:hypothetical protein
MAKLLLAILALGCLAWLYLIFSIEDSDED